MNTTIITLKNFPADLWRLLCIVAAKEGKSKKQVVIEAIEARVKEG